MVAPRSFGFVVVIFVFDRIHFLSPSSLTLFAPFQFSQEIVHFYDVDSLAFSRRDK